MDVIACLQILVIVQAVINPGCREPGISTLLIIGREKIAAVEQVFAEEIDFILQGGLFLSETVAGTSVVLLFGLPFLTPAAVYK